MTRQERIELEAYFSYNDDYKELKKQCFIEGAIWADATMIDKACDWLLCNSRNYFEASGCCTWINYGKLVDDFKKAMKRE